MGSAATSRVLLTLPMAHRVGHDILRRSCREVCISSADRADVLAEARTSDAIIVRSPARVDAEVIAAAPNLKVVSAPGIGVDLIDVGAATAAGVLVLNAAGVSAPAVVEYTLGSLVLCSRRFPAADHALRARAYDWSRRSDDLPSMELRGKVLGIVGMGAIGREVARLAKVAVGMQIVGYDPYTDNFPADVEQLELAELFAQADIVSVHTPLTETSRGLIGADLLAKLSPHACLINCGRGGVIDEAAVARMLHEGRLAFAVFDVFASEPDCAASPLASAPNCVLTPHIAGLTDQACYQLAESVALGLVRALDGSPDAARVVNRELLG
jgi:phosphoglycerate dehydrogenase-like enzyme